MQHSKKDKPLGVCDVCHVLTELHADVNHRCRQIRDGRRCSGIYKSGLGVTWEECQTCLAHGVVGRQPCTACGGHGWHLVR